MTHEYDRLEHSERAPKRVVDHSAKWAKLEPVGSVNGQVEELLAVFCKTKQVSKHESRAEEPSTWVRPIIAGKRDSLDWIIVEGETDGARLVELVGALVAVMVLPAGALTFKREWAALIPRGATVALCHDNDEEGDKGAEKAAKIIGGKTKRIRPPLEDGDWCQWVGDRADFLELAAASAPPRYEFSTLEAFLAYAFPDAEPLLGEPGAILLARGSLLMVYGADGSAKSTWTIDGIAHLAAGIEWLGVPVPRPVRICVIENEGPPSLFQKKLETKITSWSGPDFAHNLFVFKGPWGEFSFADAEAREALVVFCEKHDIDVVTANPTLGLGVAASGRPDETQRFVDWLVECGLKSERAFWLLHHENKAGAISGDWGRHPDTKVQLQQDGNKPRTKLDWAKTRWATLTQENAADEGVDARVGNRDAGVHGHRARGCRCDRRGTRGAHCRLPEGEPGVADEGCSEAQRYEHRD